MAAKTNLFWDSCVFMAYFSDNRAAYDVDSIQQYIDDAKNGDIDIYTCSIALAEIVPSAFKGGKYGSFMQFHKDLRGSVKLIDLNPNVMLTSARLKDLKYTKTGGERKLGTGDAIMLAACIHAVENYKISIDAFHTYDSGKSRGLDGGKGMPLLGYEEWCSGFTGEDAILAGKVIALNRCRPVHPSPKLSLSGTAVAAKGASPDGSAATPEESARTPFDGGVVKAATAASGNGGDHCRQDCGDLVSGGAQPLISERTSAGAVEAGPSA